MMKIEILYPSIASLYGDNMGARYFRQCLPQAEFVRTEFGDVPAFVKDNDVDMVYLGNMTQNNQEITAAELMKYKERIEELIDRDVIFLVLGSTLEVFGQYIELEDGRRIKCLGLFDTWAKRDMSGFHYNSAILGVMDNGIKILGYKAQFSHSYGDNSENYLFRTIRSGGINPNTNLGGLRRNNFMATYLVGPLLVLNPPFTKYIMGLLGVEDPHVAFEEAAMDVYRRRLARLEDPATTMQHRF